MAPRGPGRGRERGRTSTQEPKINPNNPVNLMAALENMAAAMQATAEALGQQMNNNGNGGREAQGPMTLAMEQALQAQLVLEEQRVEFATYLLTGEASHWTAKELELLQLKQGAMSISEYTDKFEELFRFSRMCQGALGDFEEWKCIKYEGGLRSDILSSVGPMEIRTFSELVNKSRIAEECVKRRVAEKGSHREHNQGFAPRGREFKGRGYIQHFSQGLNNFATSEESQRNGKKKWAAAASDVSSCQRYGSHHPNRPCRLGLGVCYKCGLPGHVSRNCQQGESHDAGRLRQ
ncbi:uncharacterized protein LOC107488086 [Arachis duranensis]|uniref:Uncharacterized protein LOC107488086 n=1 Tax=Arachis duranensis TaxID=130453 RepID=A0A6P4DGJ4_ARADU|nr:uncharacterized protein LOC107488086 [Arachis duranensis]